jgi:hypothetical protein
MRDFKVFWDVTPCRWASGPKETAVISGLLAFEDEYSTRL